MSNETPPAVPRIAPSIGTVVVTIVFAALVASVAFGVIFPVIRDGKSFDVTVNMSPSAIDSLPAYAEVASRVPVTVTVRDPSWKQAIGVFLSGIVPLGLLLFVFGELRKIVGTVRRGDPFIAGNVQRLRWVGFALLIGGPLVQIVPQYALNAVAESAGVGGGAFRYEFPGPLMLAGVGVLILAHVFAHGVRLREDVEGTV